MIFSINNDFIQLRLFSEKDLKFLENVYASTREQELKQVTDWTDEIKQAFLSQQFNAQHNYYLENYVGAKFLVIEKQKEPIGRLYIDENFGENEIRIMDITLLPAWRNSGIGNYILTEINKLAKKLSKKVTIHVESFNPAMKLYFRLGFKKISETNGVYHLLEWKQ